MTILATLTVVITDQSFHQENEHGKLKDQKPKLKRKMSMFYSDFEMPTPCQKCGELFDLQDGSGSDKWFPNTVICKSCGREEEKEIENDEEIDELVEIMDNSVYDVIEKVRELSEKKYFQDSEKIAKLASELKELWKTERKNFELFNR